MIPIKWWVKLSDFPNPLGPLGRLGPLGHEAMWLSTQKLFDGEGLCEANAETWRMAVGWTSSFGLEMARKHPMHLRMYVGYCNYCFRSCRWDWGREWHVSLGSTNELRVSLRVCVEDAPKCSLQPPCSSTRRISITNCHRVINSPR